MRKTILRKILKIMRKTMLKVRLKAMIKISDRIVAYGSCLAYGDKNMAGFFM
jgi:hypothetical protein